MPAPPLSLVLAAFAAVYVIWGSTYLGIRLAVESIPPFLMAGGRFTLAGILLYAFARWRKIPGPEPRHWLSATLIGGLLLLVGNGAVSWAQKRVPTGVTALIVASVPLWIMLVDWLRPKGRRPTVLTVFGLFVGFAGVGVIVASRNVAGHRVLDPLAGIILLLASLGWAIGSVYSRHAPKPRSPILAIAMQMLAGGALLLLTGLLTGEGKGFSLAKVTTTSFWAFIYLGIFGSLIGFTAYVWLLQVSTPAKVSTYAYVNPVIAVLLGHLVLKEEVPKSVALAGGLVLASVILVTRRSR